MNCIICLFPLEKNETHQCNNTRCQELFCRECLLLLIDFCIEEKTIPKCPAKNCDYYLTISNLNGLNEAYIAKYCNICMDFFLKDCGDEVQRQLQEKKIMDKLRTERLKFINQTYPAAIVLVSNIAFQSKIKRLDKQKKDTMKKNQSQYARKCMNITCNGTLNDKSVCLVCDSAFCSKCENVLIPDTAHECKQTDIDCVNLISNMIKCPGCFLPVFKDTGCDAITCGNCKTNFLYSTGEIGGHGSVNKAVNLNTSNKISVHYREHFEKLDPMCLERLLEVEYLEPKKISKNILLTPIKNYIQAKDKNMINGEMIRNYIQTGGRILTNSGYDITKILADQCLALAKNIDVYYKNTILIRDYYSHAAKLEELLKRSMSGSIILGYLDSWIYDLKK
jgi:hypothetical protein